MPKTHMDTLRFIVVNNKQQKRMKRILNTMTTLKTQKAIAASLGVCPATVRRWKDCPRVPISKGRHRYNLEQVKAWLESRSRKEGKHE